MNDKQWIVADSPRAARLALAMIFSIVATLAAGLVAPSRPAGASGAISAMYNPYSLTVTVTGDDTANEIIIGRTADGKILVNGGAVPISGGVPTTANTLRIEVTGRGGDDRLTITEANGFLPAVKLDGGPGDDLLSGGSRADALVGGQGRDTVVGREGNDTLHLGEDDDAVFWNVGDGNDIIEGQGGRDTLRVTGTSIDEQFEFAASGVRVRFTRAQGNFALDLAGIERVDLWASRGNDTITVNSLAGTDLVAVDLDLAAAGGGNPTDGQPDQIVVNGTGGADVVTVAGDPGVVMVSGLAAGVTIRGVEAARDTLRVAGQAGDDILDATRLPAGLIGLTLDGNHGADTLIGSAGGDTFVWFPGDGNDIVEGQGGFDTLRLTGGNVAEQIAVSANGGRVRLARDVGGFTLDLDDVERLALATLGEADTVAIGDLAGTDLTAIALDLAGAAGGDGANDRVIVYGTAGGDAVFVSGGQGTVTVSGLTASVTIRGAEAARDTLRIGGDQGADVIDATNLPDGLIALTLDGGVGNDVLVGSAGGDALLGGEGDDVLIGGPGIDVIDGGSGDDVEIQD